MEFSLIWNFNSILALLRHYISTLNIFFIYLDDSSLVVDFWLFHGIHNFVSYWEEQLGNKYQHQSLTNIRIPFKTKTISRTSTTWDALCDLVPFVQLKKREKHQIPNCVTNDHKWSFRIPVCTGASWLE